MSRLVEWNTVEVEELPQGAVVVDAVGRAYVRRGETWDVTGAASAVTPWGMEYPVLICHVPAATPREVSCEKGDGHRRLAAAAALADADVEYEAMQMRCYTAESGWDWANLLEGLEYDRQRLIGIVARCRMAIRDAAEALDRQEGASWADAVDQAHEILAKANEGHYREVTTSEELAGLDMDTIVIDPTGWVSVLNKLPNGDLLAMDVKGSRPVRDLRLPQTVIWERP